MEARILRGKVAALIAAYGEERQIGAVVRRASLYVDHVLVVDDGSTDQTARQAREAGAEVVAHSRNQGKGAAIKTGLRHLLAGGFDYIILLDGDGQHSPDEIPIFLRAAAKSGSSLVVGSRMDQTQGMPLIRRWVNRYMSAKISERCGQRVPDTQCGFRLVQASCAAALLGSSNHYDYETEMLLLAARQGCAIESVPITTIYHDQESKIRPLTDTWRFFQLMRRFKAAPPEAPGPDKPNAKGPSGPALGRSAGGFVEKGLLLLFVAALLFLKGLYLLNYRVDSDEPQHLHVVWGWVNGLMQYRDIFDNHSPLFHLLCAPVLAALGERPDIIYWMRALMLPLFFGSLVFVHLLGRQLFDRRLAFWCAIFAGLAARFHLTSTEFRTDDLWTFFWLAALAFFFAGHVTAKRCFFTGLLLGAALSVSMKTSLLAIVFLAGLAGAAWGVPPYKPPLHWKRIVWLLGCGAAGFVLIPGFLTAFFVGAGAWDPFYYCVIRHNIVPGLGRWSNLLEKAAVFPFLLFTGWYLLQIIHRHAPSPRLAFQRGALFLTTFLYITALESFWPLITREDYLPFYPLAALFWTPLVVFGAGRLRAAYPAVQRWAGPYSGLLALGFLELVCLSYVEKPWADPSRHHYHLLEQVLNLTRPGEYVMDEKGETVFRPRPFYYALEGITTARLEKGLIKDTIAERLCETRTCVISHDSANLPPVARAFMNNNYLSIGYLRVAGRILKNPGRSGQAITFHIAIPTQYIAITPQGRSHGLLDGKPSSQAQYLQAGMHRFIPAEGERIVALVWADAIERHFRPFHKRGHT